MFEAAKSLISSGHAYVDQQSADEIKENRGTLTSPGKNSPWRDHDIDYHLNLFNEMREGKHKDGSMVVRAKIDMASPNINLRDPAIYRIKNTNIIALEINGVFIQCIPLPTQLKMLSKELPIPFVR
jgi:glutaminyl-tRNA synthetase